MENLRRAILRNGAGLGDDELLSSFIERHDEAALAALVRRHGPMVWGVCRRLLAHHDAEDAFQATFLVLVRKAASVVPRAMVGNWLYGVAHQTALHARRTASRRRTREVLVEQMPDTEAEGVQEDQWADVRPVLDEELSRLPDIYRAVIALCDLEGQTRKAVARQLGVPDGTVGGRLARARVLLAKRLAQRGVVLSGGALAGMLSAGSAASAPPSLVASTIKVASLLAAGRAVGVVSVKVAALTEGVMKAMFVSKIKGVLAAVLVLVALCGATGLVCRTQAGEEPRPQKSPDEKRGDEKKGKQAKTDLEKLQGEWRVVSRTVEGEETKYTAKDANTLTVKGSSMLLTNSEGLLTNSEGKDHFRFRLDEAKSPKTFDMVILRAENLFDVSDIADLNKRFDKQLDDGGKDEGVDDYVQGIYLIDGDMLKLCMSKLGQRDEGKRPADFEAKKGSDIVLEIYERVK